VSEQQLESAIAGAQDLLDDVLRTFFAEVGIRAVPHGAPSTLNAFINR
jgi:hypothetical protein